MLFVCGLGDNARGVEMKGGGGGAIRVSKNHSWMCTRDYYGVQFILPNQGLMPVHSLDPGPAEDWGVDFHGSF